MMRWTRHALIGVVCLFGMIAAAPARAQLEEPPRVASTSHFTVGATIGLYPMGGGFGIGDQGFDYQGVHIDAIRLGYSQLVSPSFRMELIGLFGLSVLADPGYVGIDAAGEEGSAGVGYHWGFGIDGYHRFDIGITLGLGAELTFGFGEFVDTTFFRLIPAVGYELRPSGKDWFVHVRWVTGVTLLSGLEELNTAPQSNLTTTGLQLVYGF